MTEKGDQNETTFYKNFLSNDQTLKKNYQISTLHYKSC
jgi:hypothetical protein